MKKFKSFAVLTAFALALMTGCSGTTTKNYILATGGTSGTYYPFGGAIANVWNTHIIRIAIIPGSSRCKSGAADSHCQDHYQNQTCHH